MDRLFCLPFVNPLLFRVQFGNDLVDLVKGASLDFGSLFVGQTIHDVIHVVLIRLVAHLTVSVLQVWLWLEQA